MTRAPGDDPRDLAPIEVETVDARRRLAMARRILAARELDSTAMREAMEHAEAAASLGDEATDMILVARSTLMLSEPEEQAQGLLIDREGTDLPLAPDRELRRLAVDLLTPNTSAGRATPALTAYLNGLLADPRSSPPIDDPDAWRMSHRAHTALDGAVALGLHDTMLLPAALWRAEMRFTDLGSDDLAQKVRARRALTDLVARDALFPIAAPGPHEAALAVELGRMLDRAANGHRRRFLGSAHLRDVLTQIGAIVERVHDAPTHATLAWLLARHARIAGSRSEEAGLARFALERANAVRESDPPPAIAASVTVDAIRAMATITVLDRSSDDSARLVHEANDLANLLVEDPPPGTTLDCDAWAALSLVRFHRFRLNGLVADLNDALFTNQRARSMIDTPGDSLHRELLLNGGAIGRAAYSESHDLSFARAAFDDYRQLLAMSDGEEGPERRSALHNTLILVATVGPAALDPELSLAETSAWGHELVALAHEHPRYLLTVAGALRRLADGDERDGPIHEATALTVRALIAATDPVTRSEALFMLAQCATRLEHWPAHVSPSLLALSGVEGMGPEATTYFDSTATLVHFARSDTEPSADMLNIAYGLHLAALQRVFTQQVSGDDRRHWLRKVDGLVSSALCDLSRAGRPDHAVSLVESSRMLLGLEALTIASATTGKDPGTDPKVNAALRRLRTSRLEAEFASTEDQVHAARTALIEAQRELEDTRFSLQQVELLRRSRPTLAQLSVAGSAETLAYLANDSGSTTIVVVRPEDDQPTVIDADEQSPTSEVVSDLLEAYEERHVDFGRWAEVLERTGSWAWRSVMGPLHGALQQHEAVRLVPCGALALLPLHLAWREVQGERRFVIDDRTCAYSPGLLTALVGSDLRAQRWDRHLTAVGGGQPDLPWVGAERRAIEHHLRGRTIHWLEEEDPSSFLQAIRSSELVHVAVHGNARLHSEALGTLSLMGGAVSEKDLLQADMADPPRLVVLSACDSGRIDRHLPDEMRGLPLTLLASGTREVISTMWACDDLVAAWLMSELYALLAEGATPSDALMGAQRRVRAGDTGGCHESIVRRITDDPLATAYGHEAYWGGFFAIGA